MQETERYYLRFAAAYVRGKAIQGACPKLPDDLRECPLGELGEEDCERIFDTGLKIGLKMHRFKRTMGLPRVRAVLGVLYGIAPAELLDIGSGRGVFVWPAMDAFPLLPVSAVERDPVRLADLEAVRLGGLNRLSVHRMDAASLQFAPASFDTVTALELLEHIPEADRALSEAVRVARRFVVISVPSKEDSNPQHVHLFDEKRLRSMLLACNVRRVRIDYVLGHIIVVACVGEE